MNNRWMHFRSSDDSIPSTPYEAAVFLQSARLHILAYGYSSIDARMLLTDAHGRVNDVIMGREVAA